MMAFVVTVCGCCDRFLFFVRCVCDYAWLFGCLFGWIDHDGSYGVCVWACDRFEVFLAVLVVRFFFGWADGVLFLLCVCLSLCFVVMDRT